MAGVPGDLLARDRRDMSEKYKFQPAASIVAGRVVPKLAR